MQLFTLDSKKDEKGWAVSRRRGGVEGEARAYQGLNKGNTINNRINGE